MICEKCKQKGIRTELEVANHIPGDLGDVRLRYCPVCNLIAKTRENFDRRTETGYWVDEHTRPSVYFIEALTSGFVKIGYSQNPQERLKSLQNGVPFELVIIKTIKGTAEDEREIHRRFYKHRVRGEWYKFNQEIKDFIDEMPQSGL
jgi:hypothetical protein